MSVLNLENQRTQAQSWLDEFQAFETAMENRKAVWDKLDTEQKLRWVRAAAGTVSNPKTFAESKDPVVWLAIRLKRFLDGFEIEEASE